MLQSEGSSYHGFSLVQYFCLSIYCELMNFHLGRLAQRIVQGDVPSALINRKVILYCFTM
jgi:hypothetical protein